MKIIRLLIAVAAFAGMAWGQTVQISGTVLDPNGLAYQNGSGKAQLVPTNQNFLINGTNPVQSPVVINALDSFGKFSISLPNTSLIQPQSASPQWVFSFCSQTYASQPLPVCFTMTPLALTFSQDISTSIQAQSALLPGSGGGGGGGGTPCVLNALSLQINNVGAFGCIPNVVNPSPIVSVGVNNKPVALKGISYAPSTLNWSQAFGTPLTAGVQATVTLSPCPPGSDTTSTVGYQVYILDGSNNESPNVTGGTCTLTGGTSGTVIFTPALSHTTYTIESATSGVQEALNLCGGTGSLASTNVQCNLSVPGNGPYTPGGGFGSHSFNDYNFFGTLFIHTTQSLLNGYGVSINCMGRGACIQVGNLTNANNYGSITITGLSMRSPTDFSSNPSYKGVQIAHINATSGTLTVTTATAHGFRVGDMVTKMLTDNRSFLGDSVITSVPTSTTFTYALAGVTGIDQDSPGVVALSYVAFLDNASHTHFLDVGYDQGNEFGRFNNFFDFWDDESATITAFNNHGIGLNANANWTGSYIFSGGNVGHTTAALITLRDSTVTAQFASGITDYNSNGVFLDNTVMQATGPWQLNISNTTGNFQGATVRNIYSESAPTNNGFALVTGTATGTFVVGEQVTQSVTGATAWILNAATGSSGGTFTMTRTATPDATHVWTGSISGATLSPTVAPSYRSPYAGLGTAGLIAGLSTGVADFEVSGVQNPLGGFITAGAGATPFSYFIVARDVTAGTQTSPMQVLNWLSTGSETSIPVEWPRIGNAADTITYDVIRMTTPGSSGTSYPSNGNCPGGAAGVCGYVAHNLSQATACTGQLVCFFVDAAANSTTAYTVAEGNYAGQLMFWPGSIVSVNRTVTMAHDSGNLVGVGLGGNPIARVSNCQGNGFTGPGGYNVCLGTNTGLTNAIPNQAATLLSDGGESAAVMTFTKGRLNFTSTPFVSVYPHHIVTLLDSNPALTQATVSYRPPASASDTYIGTDVASTGATLANGQLSFGAPVAISNYINNIGDGTNYMERLTASLKDFRPPVLFETTMLAPAGCNGCGPFTLSGSQVSDNFNRANGGLGANWTTNGGTWTISNNQVVVTGVSGFYTTDYTGSTFIANQYAQANFVFGGIAGIRIRGTGATDGYICGVISGTAFIDKVVSGSAASLATVTSPYLPGDLLGCVASGTTITMTRLGAAIQSVTDSTFTSGNLGLFGQNTPNTTTYDNFRAGDLSWTASAALKVATMQYTPGTFASLVTCAAGTEGLVASVNDSSTNTWGATITGGSTNHVLALCDGSVWTVMGK